MKMRLFFYTSIVCVFGLLIQSCEKDDKETKPEFSLEQPDVISDENYNVYSLVIEERYSSEQIVIAQQTTKTRIGLGYVNDLLIEKYQDFDTNLIKTHDDLNENSINFGENFHGETKEIILIPSEELSYIFVNGGWDEFYNVYENSNGIIRFSRIAFNDDKTQAIFEIGHSYANLGGGGSIIYLNKQNDTWTILEVIRTWVS